MKKIIILTEFFSKKLNRNVKVGETFEADKEQLEKLDNIGVKYKDDEDSEDDTDENDLDLEDEESEDDNLALIESYKADKSIVDDLKADDLKILCDAVGIAYRNAKEAKEALQIATLG